MGFKAKYIPDGILTRAKLVNNGQDFLSADATGRAIMSTGFFDATKAGDAFAANSIPLAKLAELVIQADGGQAFTADQSMGGFKLTNLATGTAGTDAVNVDQLADFIKKDGTVAFTADQPMGSNKLTGLAPGTAGTDAVNKDQLDSVSAGFDSKGSVKVASDDILTAPASVLTANYNNTGGTSGRGQITGTKSGFLSVDGVNIDTIGQRILLKNEGDGGGLGADANGIWELTFFDSGNFTLERTTDFDEDAEVSANAYVFASEGTTNADKMFVLTTNDPITIGGASGTALTFAAFQPLSLGGTPSTIQPDDAADAGSSSTAARSDHTHAIAAAAPGTIEPDDAAAEGVATSFARSDHTHAISTAAPGTIEPDDAAAEGVSTSFARADHTHAIGAAAPSAGSITNANAEGASTSFARADHTHKDSKSEDNVRDTVVTDTTASDGDNPFATGGQTVNGNPVDGMVEVFVGPLKRKVGDGVKTTDCYFSGDGGTTARAHGAIQNGDTFHWNGSVAGFQLSTVDADEVTWVYRVPSA